MTRRRTDQRRRRREQAGKSRRTTGILIALVLVVTAGIAVAVLVGSRAPREALPWARLGTEDVHSLAFAGEGTDRVLFGHHGGLLATADGGRTWDALSVGEDAMSTATSADGSIIIAGHEVFRASRDGGTTWASITTDLPSLDIHGFTRDPVDPARMWAYPVTGGLWESIDGGATFRQVRTDNVLFPTAVAAGSGIRLLGVETAGLIESSDGGRTWSPLAMPPTFPMTGLAASADGRILYAGAQDGLYRSEDGGHSWEATAYTGSVFALATSTDGRTVILVDRTTDVYRSDDGGATWPGPGE
jgi:photosystem II stability/assembly factor-like uncharacterized protein